MAGFADVDLSPATAQAVVAGDSSAMEQAYQALATPVMTLAVRLLREPAQAQEVVQDTFVDLIERGNQIGEPAALVGWVRRVAINHCLMRLRSPWHQRRDFIGSWEDGTGGVPEQVEPKSNLAQTLPDIERALGQLPDDTRVVIWLHDVEGFTHKEIGTLLERTSSYSKSQLARGYSKLAKLYQSDDSKLDGTQIGSDTESKHAGNSNDSADPDARSSGLP